MLLSYKKLKSVKKLLKSRKKLVISISVKEMSSELAELVTRPLFGGAITAMLPTSFDDMSKIREVS